MKKKIIKNNLFSRHHASGNRCRHGHGLSDRFRDGTQSHRISDFGNAIPVIQKINHVSRRKGKQKTARKSNFFASHGE